MKTVTISGKEFWAGSARVEPDLATLNGSMVVMKLATCMDCTMKRLPEAHLARNHAAELNALPINKE